MLFSTASTVEYSVVRRLSNIESNQFSRASERSRTITRAPMPTAMRAALYTTTPPPMITTSAAGTPGTPPSKTPARKSAVQGKSVSVRVDIGGRRRLQKKTQKHQTQPYHPTHTTKQ